MSLDMTGLLYNDYCFFNLSKNLNGTLTLVDADHRSCTTLGSNTLVHQEVLRLDAASNPDCDSDPYGAALDGVIRVRYYVTAFAGSTEVDRGVHAGRFDWTPAAGGRMVGSLNGITNAGVLRAFIPDCEQCRTPGIVSGQLFATGKGVPGVPSLDFQVQANYRLAWDPLRWNPANPQPTSGPVRGTLEGVVIILCP